jgi:nucleobase:cation symporter-1, NCS1 family
VSTEVVGGLPLETNGINVIPDAERRGKPSELFWPWFAANVSVFGIAYGAWLLGYFSISFWQATIAGIIGCVASFVLVGLVSLSGKLASAPTMVISRASFGVQGNKLPTLASWVLLVGWETVLVYLGATATATVLGIYGLSSGDAAKIIGLVIMVVLVAGGGILGFTVVMRMQTFITIVTIILTVVYIVLTINKVHWSSVTSIKGGSTAAVIGAAVFAFAGFGLGWVNSGADYSRYLPRRVSSAGVVAWTTLGASLGPIVLIVWGSLLAGSDSKLAGDIGNDPIGALANQLPHWFLWLFLIVVLLGFIGGAVMDIYSSGLALLSIGLKIPRWSAAGIDAILMTLGAIYLIWISKSDFVYTFEAFLAVVGVPIAAWCGIFLADMALRKAPLAEDELYDGKGRYGSFGWLAIGTMIVCMVLGWGLIYISYAPAFTWTGYLFKAFGLGDPTKSVWASANLGVVIALALGFVVQFIFGRFQVAKQEAEPISGVHSGV